jgi:peptide/nickel transport system permease protein
MGMLTYVIRRVLEFIPTVFIAVTLIFILTRLAPGNPVWALIGDQSVSAEKIDQVTKELGLDRPILVQYVEWLPKALTGDLGYSLFYKKPVLEVILERFPITLSIAGPSTLLAILIALPIGILSAIRRNSLLDNLSMLFSTVWISLPSFWLGFLFILLFSVFLRWFPSSGYRDLSFGFGPWASRLILPVLALSLAHIALLVRMTRSSMLQVLGNEYIVAARAKGLKEVKVIYKHALRNAFISIVTVIGLIFALSLGGSVIIENVFAIPGLGQLVTTAALRRDYPIIEGGVLYLTFISLVVNLLVDISYTLINPRISYE